MTRALVLVLLALLFAGPAHAGTIAQYSERTYEYMVFTAAPGEQNHVTIEQVRDGVRVTDTAALPGGCPAVGPHSVLCPNEPIDVIAGDGDDTVSGDEAMTLADGGEGNDVLSGGHTLVGGPGDDRFLGAPGNQRIVPGPGRNVIDGGPGEDAVSYKDRAGVRVDLAAHTGPDGDTVRNVEDVEGTRGADVLLGDGHANDLDGEGGNDRVEGRGGADVLRGNGPVRGGAGNDQIIGRTRVDCGAGTDRIYVPLGSVPRLRGCERVDGSGPIIHISGNRLRVSFHGFLVQPCHVFINGQSARSATVRRPVTVRVTTHGRCVEAWDDPFRPLRFRLL